MSGASAWTIRWTRHRVWIVVVGGWALVGLVTASQVYLASISMEHEATFGAVAWWTLPVWLFWALVTPAVVWLGRRVPLERGRLAWSLPLHLAVAVLLAVTHLAWWLTWTQLVSPYALEERSFVTMMWIYVQARFNVSFLVYWAILGVSYAVTYSRRLREREVDSAQLESRLVLAQLQALRAQVQPHFLFNTLHAISTLVTQDPDKARHMIARLGDLMRLVLERDADQEVPLSDELDTIDIYLDIEQTRFGDRLTVTVDVDHSLLDAMVPNLILQPLVENAIRHGVARLEGPAEVRLQAARRDGRLVVRIENDAPAEAGPGPRQGVGLGNARARLARLYGSQHILEAGRDATGRFQVVLEVPFRRRSGKDER